MSFDTLIAYIIATFFVCASPGPNMLHIMTSSARLGFIRTLIAMSGCMAAVLILLITSAIGLAAILQEWPRIFIMLRYLGAAYLAYLGFRIWVEPFYNPVVAENLPNSLKNRRKQIFRNAFFIGISNPKAVIFAAAFFPQFINPTMPRVPQLAVLLAIFIIIESSWYIAYATFGAAISRFLERPASQLLFKIITGSIFIGFGIAIIVV